jgi:pimeloyl-ACP methyl ester carboxylesterase
MTEYTITSRGDRVGYDLRGTGPAVIFVAGAGPFRAMDPTTTETAERLAEAGLTTLVFDRLGRGDSPAEGRLDLDRELDVLRALLDVVGGTAVLCGHSSGCSISLRAAVAGLPVDGLALWEAPLASDAADTRAWSDEIERRMDAGDLEGAFAHYMKDFPPEWLAEAQSSPEWEMIAAGVVSTRADAQSLAWATAALRGGGLKEIGVPVLCTYGTETFPEMPEAAKLLTQAIPGAEEKAVAGKDHEWNADAMAAELLTFVRAVNSVTSA